MARGTQLPPYAGVSNGSYLGQVSNRCRIPTSQYGSNTYFQGRIAHRNVQAVTQLQLVFPNFYVIDSYGSGTLYSELGSGVATLTASIEYPAGTFTQLTWGGAAAVNIAPVSMSPPSDPCAVSIPAGATYWVRWLYKNASGIIFCEPNSPTTIGSNALLGDTIEGGTGTPTDKTMGGTISNSFDGYYYGPCAVLATTTAPSVLVIGDSRDYGIGDAPNSGYVGDLGQVCRSLFSGNIAYIDASVAGDAALYFPSYANANRRALAGYVTHVEIDYGANDVNGNYTAAQIETNLKQCYGCFPNKRLLGSTITPIGVTSSDNFATLANQTVPSNDAARQALNTWLRGKAGGLLQACWDISSVLESGSTGKWNVTGSANGYTGPNLNPGTHANQAGYLQVASSGVVNVAKITR